MLSGGVIFLYNRGAVVIGRNATFSEDGVIGLVEDFASILLFVGFFPSRIVTISLQIGRSMLEWRLRDLV